VTERLRTALRCIEPTEPTASGRAFLLRTSFLAKLDADGFDRIYEELEWLRLSPGAVLFEQGAPGDSLFILVSGRLGASVSAPGKPTRLVGEINSGESIGEMGVLTQEPRSASIFALRDSIVVRLSDESFRRLVEKHPLTLMVMSQMLVERLRESLKGRKNEAHTKIFSIFGAASPDLRRAFCDMLAAELSHWGRVLHLSKENIKTRAPSNVFGTGSDAEIYRRLVLWLHEQEQSYDYILLEADTTDESAGIEKTPWTTLCIDHGDRLLMVGDGRRGPESARAIKPLLHKSSGPFARRRELVLVHPDNVQTPRGTRLWLTEYRPDAHYHVRLGVSDDGKRLARYLTDRAICLALAGGGALGMAHIGVARALAEAGVPIDLTCGASAGANIGAQIACGFSFSEIEARTRKAFPKHLFFDFDLPVVSMLRTRVLIAGFKKIFGDARIEDQWIKYFCAAANLTRARVELLDEGPLCDRIMASGSLPGFYPPQSDEKGDLLVDGAVLDNLPAGHISQYCRGKVIAVNVIPTLDSQIMHGLPSDRSSLRLLWDKVKPGGNCNFPTILHIALRSIFLRGVVDAEKIAESADLYIEPPLEQFSFHEMGKFDSIVKLGYQSARTSIERWLREDPEAQRIVDVNAVES